MQVKIIVGTIAFMLTMMVLGYAALREPERMEHFTGAREGRQTEIGAKLYSDNCATCHGEEGRAEVCYDAGTGEAIPCVGRALNNYFLVCGSEPERLVETNYEGTKEQFIAGTIAAGRTGTQMVAWLDTYGGPMRADQVENVTIYVLNYESEELCAEPPAEFPWPATTAIDELFTLETTEPVEFVAAPGDPERGAELYVTYTCNTCHGIVEEDASTAQLGPWLGNIAEVGGDYVEGYTAQMYVYESILNPNAFISPDCPTGPCTSPSAMPADFGSRMATAPQDMIDLLAYLVGE